MTTATPTRLNVAREYRIGDNSDEGIAATTNDLIECACCGRKIARVTVLTNGAHVGSECAVFLTRPDLRDTPERSEFFFGKRNRKAEAYLNAGGYA
jgi:hypothetical protein